MKSPRYPGSKPFSPGQEKQFFGRDLDIAALHRKISFEDLTVLYSKSGIGKSSLINAGLLPKIKERGRFTPIRIRFGAWAGEKEVKCQTITTDTISHDFQKNTFLDQIIPQENSFWYHAKMRQVNGGGKKLLLIFDQFEELFTYEENAILEFKKQLNELIKDEIPQRFRELLSLMTKANKNPLSPKEEELLHEPLQIKVLIAIRSDRLHLLNNLNDYIPDILGNCYKLDALDPKDAQAAILLPAQLKGDYISPPFTFEKKSLKIITNFLTDESGKVEPILLQILCATFEDKVVSKNLTEVRVNDKEDLQNIIDHFYQSRINAIPTLSEKKAAILLIENGLLLEEKEQRLTLHQGQIESLFSVSPDTLKFLVNKHLLRSEPSLKGGFNYEISHDRLVPAVMDAKRVRLHQEAIAAQEKEKAERQRELQAEKAKRQRASRIAAIMGSLALLALVVGGFAWYQANVARSAKQEAVEAKDLAEKEKRHAVTSAQEALRQKGIAVNAREEADSQRAVALANEAEAIRLRNIAEYRLREVKALMADGDVTKWNDEAADTYSLLTKSGNTAFAKGDYDNAWNYFTLSTHIKKTGVEQQWIDNSLTGLKAEKYFYDGDLAIADSLYQRIVIAYPEDTLYAGVKRQRIGDANALVKKLRKKYKNSQPDTLSLSGERLFTVPSAIFREFNRGKLTHLDLSSNQISRLPNKIKELNDYLKWLNLSFNEFTELPPELGDLSELKELNISSNYLAVLPQEIGDLSDLKELDASSNMLTALPDNFENLKKLKTLKLASNQLQDLPSALWQLPKLKKLDLNANLFQSLPKEIDKLDKIEELKLASNQLSQLPPRFAELNNLKKLHLSDNQFTQFPSQLYSLGSLKKLRLDNNKLKILPKRIGELKQLTELDFSFNSLETLPDEICDLFRLEEFYIEGNRLKLLPKNFWHLNNLKTVNLASNQLESLPNIDSVMTRLKELHLENNKLQELPLGIGKFHAVKEIDLANNEINSLPPEVGNWINLKELNLAGNNISKLPAEASNWTKLEKLDLENTDINKLPEESRNWVAIKEINLKNTDLETWPEGIAAWTKLKKVNVNNCDLDSLPREIGTWTDLKKFEAEESGILTIPNEIGNCVELMELNLKDNSIKSIPKELWNCSKLVKLDLSKNTRIDAIPAGIENLTALEKLDLSDNNIETIPVGIGKLESLKKLDLSDNDIEKVPPEIGNLESLIELNLKGNSIDALPPEISKLINLQILILRKNDLSHKEEEKIRAWLPNCKIIFD